MKGDKIRQVKEWLLSGKGLTVQQSEDNFGYQRLSAGICTLRKRGMDIRTLRVRTQDGTTFAIYYTGNK